jgi:hypothetical protein
MEDQKPGPTNISEFVRIGDELKVDLVNHPPHYNHGKFEHVKVALDWRLGGLLYNCTKYICRAGHKDGAATVLDLEKGLWYLKEQIRFSIAENDGFGLARHQGECKYHASDVCKDWNLGPELTAAMVTIAHVNRLLDAPILSTAVDFMELRVKEIKRAETR